MNGSNGSMGMKIGVGDVFTLKKEHWSVIDVKGDIFICKNKNTGAVAEFNKETIKDLIK